MSSRSSVANAPEQNFNCIGITSFTDVFLGEKISRFIVSQVYANKRVDLIGRLKATNTPQFDNGRCCCGFCDTRN